MYNECMYVHELTAFSTTSNFLCLCLSFELDCLHSSALHLPVQSFDIFLCRSVKEFWYSIRRRICPSGAILTFYYAFLSAYFWGSSSLGAGSSFRLGFTSVVWKDVGCIYWGYLTEQHNLNPRGMPSRCHWVLGEPQRIWVCLGASWGEPELAFWLYYNWIAYLWHSLMLIQLLVLKTRNHQNL